MRDAAFLALRAPLVGTALELLEQLVPWPDGAYVALTYHRVDEPSARPWLYPPLLSATPDGFTAQMRMLSRRYTPVDMWTVLAAQRREGTLPDRAVTVTFDDGYRDFAEHSWPVLRGLNIPVTLFVSTWHAGEQQSFWWDRLWAAISSAPAGTSLHTPFGSHRLGTPSKRLNVAGRIVERVKAMSHGAGMALIDDVCQQLSEPPARSDVLSWEELRQLAREGVVLAPHTRDHPVLTRVSPTVVAEQARASRSDLLRAVGINVADSVLAYPTGAYDDGVVRAISEGGMELCFTTRPGLNRVRTSHPLELRRLNVSRRSHARSITAAIMLGRARQLMGR